MLPAPGFAIGVRASEEEIEEIAYLPPQAAAAPRTPLAKEAAEQLAAWLADPRFAFSLPLAPAGTAFQRRVWQAIAAIPCGATKSYGELARRLKTSARAIGGACAANPYPIVIPCHRVIAADGRLGGFSGSREGFHIAVKRWLLAHERS